MRRSLLLILLASLLSLTGSSTAEAAEFVTVSGKLSNYLEVPIGGAPNTVVVAASGSENITEINSRGEYEILVPKKKSMTLTFVVYEPGHDDEELGFTKNSKRMNPGFSNWATNISEGLSVNSRIDLQLPKPVKLELSVTDSQTNVIPQTVVSLPAFNQSHDDYVFGGYTWSGIQRINNSTSKVFSEDGTFRLIVYPSKDFIVDFCKPRLEIASSYCASRTVSPTFSLQSDASYFLCLPINLDQSNATSKLCIDSVLEEIAQRAASESMKSEAANVEQKGAEIADSIREASEKLATEQKVAEKAIAQNAATANALKEQAEAEVKRVTAKFSKAKKMISLVCVKGKVIRKVVGMNPKCPRGFVRK